MNYTLKQWLKELETEGAVALHFSEGAVPVAEMLARPRDAQAPSVMLFPLEAPQLTREDLQLLAEALAAHSVSESTSERLAVFRSTHAKQQGEAFRVELCYDGLGQFRYRNGGKDFDVLLFATDHHLRIVVRHPHPSATTAK